MLVLWFQLELWAVVIQHIWKKLSLLKEYKLLSDPTADISSLFFPSARRKRFSHPFLLERTKHQAFKTCLWPTGNLTRGLFPDSPCPIEASFAEGTGREERAARRSLLCWALVLYLRWQPLYHRRCSPSFWPLDKSYLVMYTKWVQVSW